MTQALRIQFIVDLPYCPGCGKKLLNATKVGDLCKKCTLQGKKTGQRT